MGLNVRKEGDKFIFEFPTELPRWNQYMEDAEAGTLGYYPFFSGLIIHHRKDGNDYDEIGFAGTIDMSYKDKGDQISDFIVMWDGDEESFIKKCGELGIDVMTYEW
jgi:hypothetical protein